MEKRFEAVDKKFSLSNSYFKNRKENYPGTILEIAHYWREYNDLPFAYLGDNWAYDAMCERQKRFGVRSSQYLTPDKVASQIAALTDNFNPEDMKVLNACCGIGQLIKPLLERGFDVEGFDVDREMTQICEILYPQAKLCEMNFMEAESDRRWELILANPPHELKLLRPFMEWLSSAMSKDGKAILILPAGYMKRGSPSSLAKILKRFNVSHEEELAEAIPFTATKSVIQVVELSQEYKDLYFTDNPAVNTGINDQNQKTDNKPIKKLEIMEVGQREKTYMVPLEQIKPNPDNPRKKITEQELEELAKSIRQSGLLQSVILRKKEDYFEIVCGERRYLAFIKNGQAAIPAYIRELSDTQVMEMALAENLQRKNLTPMEESYAFLRFIETGKYTVEDLVNTFGKTESYIRGRLRMQNLTDDFKALLANEEITFSVGLEITKYDLKTQGIIFNGHFRGDESTSWKELGAKELAGRIERIYTTDLSKYNFDKKECEKCPSNTGTYSLFANPAGGRCTNSECLNRKKTDFTLGCCKVLQEHYDNMDVCVTPYDKLDDDTRHKLEERGVEVKTVMATDYPTAPSTPERSMFKTEEEFEKAKDEYKIEALSYNHEVDEIEAKIEKGELKRLIYIGDNNPKLCYVPVTADPDKAPLKALQEEDEANKRIAKNGVIKELSQLLKTCVLSPGAFSEFEEQAVFYFMLDSLNANNYPLFGIKDTNMKCLPDDTKYKLCKSLTAAQKAIIQRDFLIRHLVKGTGSNASTTLLISFARQHFPQESEDVSRKYTESYNTKYQKLKKQMDQISDKKKELVES